MEEHINKGFFENIRRYIKISYFVSSIIPLAVLAYLSLKYIYPQLAFELPVDIGVILFLSVFLSLLGLALLMRTTNTSLVSLQNFHLRLDGLIEITKQFRETLYIDILLEDIVESAINLNSAAAGSLLLCDESGNLRYKFLIGENQILKDRIVKRGEDIAGWVAETGEPALINDVTKDTRYKPDFDNEIGIKRKSIMCVPLIYNNETIGVIEIINKKDGIFVGNDLNLLHVLADQAAISIAQSKVHERQHSDIIHITEILVSAQDNRTPEKKGHVRRVAKYANLIGKNLGLSETDLKNLYYASLLHDIGFLKIERGGTFADEVGKSMKHPQLGYEIIKPISLWEEAAEIILQHHERFDGTGYPSGKKGDEILLASKILFVAETFDVLTSEHSYKKPIHYDAAIEEIQANSETQFDPIVVEALISSIKEQVYISE